MKDIKQIDKFKKRFHKKFISTMTSEQFKFPPDNKSSAMIKWLEISVIFDSTMDDLFGTQWRDSDENN